MRQGSRAITLIEILIATAVVIVILSSAAAVMLPSREEAEVKRAVDAAFSTLQLARSRTVASRDLSSWGVHLEAGKAVLFKGSVYSAADPANEVFTLSSRVTIRSISLGGGGVDVVFARPNGTTNNVGTFEVASKASANFHTIRIESSGIVGVDTGAPSSLLNPNQDTRHVHFTLGWSIQNSTTMTLTFQDAPNPDVIETVTMTPYFNSDKSRFDWSGTTNVNGQVQGLRIHTHSLTPTNTVLSIVRDRRFNTKAVTIAIGGNNIATYAADGTLTVGPFGGTLEVQ